MNMRQLAEPTLIRSPFLLHLALHRLSSTLSCLPHIGPSAANAAPQVRMASSVRLMGHRPTVIALRVANRFLTAAIDAQSPSNVSYVKIFSAISTGAVSPPN